MFILNLNVNISRSFHVIRNLSIFSYIPSLCGPPVSKQDSYEIKLLFRRRTMAYAPINSKQFKSIWTFEDWLVQIPSPRGKKAVQMPHQLLLKYLSSRTNFVFNQTLYTLFRERCRNDTFKLLLKTLLKELLTDKGEILSCKSVKPCKNRKNSRAYYVRTRDKFGSNSPPFKRNVQIPPSPGRMHSQMPGGGDVEVSNWSAH